MRHFTQKIIKALYKTFVTFFFKLKTCIWHEVMEIISRQVGHM